MILRHVGLHDGGYLEVGELLQHVQLVDRALVEVFDRVVARAVQLWRVRGGTG